MTAGGGDPLDLAGRAWPNIAARTVVVPGCSSLDYEERGWVGALVIVQSGELELETVGGARRSFGPGDILYLTGLRLRALSNRRGVDVVLQVIFRKDPPHP